MKLSNSKFNNKEYTDTNIDENLEQQNSHPLIGK